MMKSAKAICVCVLAGAVPLFFAGRAGTADTDLSTSAAVTRAEAPAPPRLLFDRMTQDFGMAKQGEKVVRRFGFANVGGSDLVIGSLKSTCGCTAAVASTGPYRPGERGEVEVSYDSRGKVGFAHKEVEVFSNASNLSQTLTIQGTVLEEGSHPMIAASDVLFSGSCAQCHALPAQGKKGKELYDAVCFLCHDFPQEGGKKQIAAGRNDLAKMGNKQLKRLISKGIARSSMPGFDVHSKGPLTEDQIDSLVEYLASIREKK